MIAWASVVALITALVAFLSSDMSSLLTGIAELAAVTAVFALVCASVILLRLTYWSICRRNRLAGFPGFGVNTRQVTQSRVFREEVTV